MIYAITIITLLLVISMLIFLVRTRYDTTDAVYEFIISQINLNDESQYYYNYLMSHHEKSFVFELQNKFSHKMDSILYTCANWNKIATLTKDYLIDKIEAYNHDME